MRKCPVNNNAIGIFDDRHNAVVGMQINPAVRGDSALNLACLREQHTS